MMNTNIIDNFKTINDFGAYVTDKDNNYKYNQYIYGADDVKEYEDAISFINNMKADIDCINSKFKYNRVIVKPVLNNSKTPEYELVVIVSNITFDENELNLVNEELKIFETKYNFSRLYSSLEEAMNDYYSKSKN